MEVIKSGLENLPPRRRGQYSNKFRKTEIYTNHYKVQLKGISIVVVFSVKIEPRIASDDIKTRNRIIQTIRSSASKKIGKVTFRGFNMFASKECNEIMVFKADEYTVTIAQRKVYEVEAKKEVLKLFLNATLRGIMSRLNYVEIGKSGKYFNIESKTSIDSLYMYKGYVSSFNETEKGVYLRVDTARKIVRKDTVMNFIDSIYKKQKCLEMSKDQKRHQVRNALVGCSVMTSYGKPDFYRVLDIIFDLNMMDVYINEQYPTLKHYYSLKYNIEIQKEKQPLILAQNKIRKKFVTGNEDQVTYLIPELCQMTGIPENFDEARRKTISQNTIKPPFEKYKEIQALRTIIKKTGESQVLSDMGIEISPKLNKMQACQITNPSLELGQKKFVQKGKQAFFNLFANPIFQAKHDVKVVILHTRNADVSPMIDTFKKTAKNLKAEITIYKIEGPMFKQADALKLIDRALKEYEQCNILMLVLPNSLKNAYPNLKTQTLAIENSRQILTQCLLEPTLKRKGVQSIHTKLLLQMLAKRGNILWIPSYKEEMNRVLQRTMILGIDSGSKGGVNIMAACGTVNSTLSNYASATVNTSPDKGDQKYQSMLNVTSSCLDAYVKRNKSAPKELIIFMNTSPGDQISLYQENFSAKLTEIIQKTYNTTVALTVVMVNLRNSQRFFTTDPEPKNVPPGTLVSTTVVSKNYDFYIVSQMSRNGAIVPNHYKVITCESKLQEGHLQELIYSQCFNYANWTGSIKIPSVLQYAKKCARFNAEVVSGRKVSVGLQSRPYYI